MRGFTLIVLLAALAAVPAGAQPAATDGPKLKVVREIDNERVTVLRLTMPPGYRDPVTSGDKDLVVTQASPGELEALVGTEKTTAMREVGQSWFVPKGTPHAFSNPGRTAFDVIVTILK